MNLIPRDSLFNFDSMLDSFLAAPRLLTDTGASFFSPRVDIRELDKRYEVSAELPGVKKEDLKVTLENGMLTLEAEINQQATEKNARVMRQERRYGKFQRSFSLNGNINEKEIEASFKDGILTLKIPRREQKTPESHRIEIH